MPSYHLILCRPLLLLPSIFPSIRAFSNESALRIRWPNYWSFSFNINPFNEHPGLSSFRMDWLDLLAVQGTLKRVLGLSRDSSAPQFKSINSSALTFLYSPTLTSIAWLDRPLWARQCLLFNMPSRLVTAFLPRQNPLPFFLAPGPHRNVLSVTKE